MSDPSQLVAPQLLPHLHLISRFPLARSPPQAVEKILEQLIQAPTYVRDGFPMQWQYIQPPDDGVMFLTWQPPSRNLSFPSDGYVWADVERGFEKEIHGYILEILIHQAGFVPGRDQVTAHSRWRYRIRSKSQANPAHIEPQLWIVHYRPAEPAYHMRTRDVPPHPDAQRIYTERQFLESQGAIQQKQFMLYDRSAWPQVTMPQVARRMPAAANAAMHAAQRQMPGMAQHPQFYPGAAGQVASGPPAKRIRQVGPAQMPTGVRAPPTVLPHDQELEDAEDTTAGDYLDYITPATISRMRYKQHHMWLEEVFSSIYSMDHIIPEDMGFGLVGELGELTKDILSVPSQDRPQSKNPNAPLDTEGLYRPLEPEKLAEFERRVADFVDRKEMEMTEMRERHSKIMARINKGKTYLDAEERLREAGTDSQKIEEIVREVELDMGITLQERKDVICVQKGGLQDEDEKQMNGSAAGSSGAAEDHFTDDTAAGLLDEFTSTADFTNSEHIDKVDSLQSEPVADSVAPDVALDLVDDMDLDVEGIEFPSGSPTAETDAKAAEDEWVHVSSKQPSPAAPLAATTEDNEKSILEQTSESNDVHNGHTVDADDVLQPESMFDGADFGSFDGLEGGGAFDASDDLLNFDGEFGGDGSAEGSA